MAVLLIFSYFAFKALQDAIMATGKGFNSKAKYANPLVELSELKPLYKAYHQAVGASYKEKYLFAASLLVAFTDLWHFIGLLRHSIVFVMCYNLTNQDVVLSAIIYSMALVIFNFVFTVYKSFNR